MNVTLVTWRDISRGGDKRVNQDLFCIQNSHKIKMIWVYGIFWGPQQGYFALLLLYKHNVSTFLLLLIWYSHRLRFLVAIIFALPINNNRFVQEIQCLRSMQESFDTLNVLIWITRIHLKVYRPHIASHFIHSVDLSATPLKMELSRMRVGVCTNSWSRCNVAPGCCLLKLSARPLQADPHCRIARQCQHTLHHTLHWL